ncbi:unnamed protein product [Urochloa humidicola]
MAMAMASRNMAERRTRPPPPARMDDDDLVEEILFRIPPDDPRSLARAAAVCKRWRGLVADPAFLLRRTRSLADLHPAPSPPPMLGFFYRRGSSNRFMPTSSFRPPADADAGNWRALDARHGRVLFLDDGAVPQIEPGNTAASALVVWSPATGQARRVPAAPLLRSYSSWNAALLCAGGGRGAFTVVVVGTEAGMTSTSAFVYSSKDHRWSGWPARIEQPSSQLKQRRGAIVGDKLYFLRELGNGILEYDLRRRELSVIKLPPECSRSSVELMAAEEDSRRLGLAMVRDLNLYLWSMDESYCFGQRQIRWTQQRVIELRSLLPVAALSFSPCIVAVADGVGVVFV